MLVLRFLGFFFLLLLVGLGVAFAVTRDRKYLRLGWRTFQAAIVFLVAYGLFYIFSRVLLF